MLDALRARLRNILRRDAVAIEMEEELRQHLEQSAELLVRRGMPPDEALLAARQALGNRTVIAEDARRGAAPTTFADTTAQAVGVPVRLLSHLTRKADADRHLALVHIRN